MTLQDFIRFSNDLRDHAHVKTSIRRMGDRTIFKISGREFFFSRDGHYLGTGRDHHFKLRNLLEAQEGQSQAESA